MGTKTISITEEAYDILKTKKRSNESFSEIIIKLSGKKPLSSFYGILSKKSGDALANAIAEGREEHALLHKKREFKI